MSIENAYYEYVTTTFTCKCIKWLVSMQNEPNVEEQ